MQDADLSRDMLLGMFAVQNDLLPRDRLLAAVAAWSADKSRPLADRLIAEGGLSPGDAELLRPLVDRHLAERGGEPSRSIADLSSLSGLADDLRSLNDVAVTATLPPPEPPATLSPIDPSATATHVPPSTRDADPDATHVPPGGGVEVELPAGTSRYRVLKPHAEGGLGKVSVAEDLELHREVALKEIKGRFADDPAARGRFLLEAEVTGGLEHPGIVPVYGLGRDAGGRPYYAMRFVQGDTLKDAADAFHKSGEGFESVAFRKLLGRFVDVCQAIAYAHSRGVLHRDLKPGNVMLGKYGETLVVDWGLAKVAGKADIESGEQTLSLSSGSGSVETQAGQAVGTPAYMPPEQAAGRLEDVGPQSDVYSLGATLYHLLCGRPPAAGRDVAELFRRIESGELPAPRSVREDVPKPLEAVCLKALSRDRSARYASCGDLAEECERWLADEPVSAIREPLALRARRWVRNHPALVASTAAVLLVSVAGAAGFSTVLSGKNRELTVANTAEREAREDAEAARATAEANEAVARQQSELALATLTGVVTDVQREIADLPRGRAVSRRLLNRSLASFEDLADELLAAGAADRTRMVTLQELSGVLLTIGTGEPDSQGVEPGGVDTGTGSPTRSAVRLASRFADEALAIAESLAAADPDSEAARKDLSVSLSAVGDVRHTAGDTVAAAAAYERSLKVAELRLGAAGENGDARRDMSSVLTKLADVHLARGETAAAMAVQGRALEIAESLTAAAPGDAESRRQLSVALSRMGRLRLAAGGVSEALALFERAIGIYESLAADDPDNAAARRDLMVALDQLGNARLATGDIRGGLAAYERGVSIAESAAAADPENAEVRRDLSVSLERLGTLRMATGDASGALALHERSLGIAEPLAAADPENAAAQRDLSVSLDNVGDARLATDDLPGALEAYERSLAIREALVEDDPNSAEARRLLSISLEKLGDASLAMEDFAAALEPFERSLEIFESLAAADAANLAAQRDLSISLEKLGDVRLATGDAAAATADYERSLAIRDSLVASDPAAAEARRMVCISHYKLGMLEMSRGNPRAANERFRNALSVIDAAKQDGVSWPGLEDMTAAIREVAEESKSQSVPDDWESVVALPADRLPAALRSRALAMSIGGRHDLAAQAAGKLRSLDNASGEHLYDAACVFGRCAASIDPADGATTDEEQARRSEWIDAGLETLDEAVERGWDDVDHTRSDADLDPLRGRPEFNALLKRIEVRPDADESEAEGERRP